MNIYPVVTIVGRPNVGKSSLFNVLTHSRQALVADIPGVTRDRIYSHTQFNQKHCLLVDTGGLSEDTTDIYSLMEHQAKIALEETTIILFLVDARVGLTAQDELIAEKLRHYDKPVILVVNKTDGLDDMQAASDFYSLGFNEILLISATHRRGIQKLITKIADRLPIVEDLPQAVAEGIKIALVGRPNVGKSTLTNRILGEERVLTFDAPGTTRDSIFIPFQKEDKEYTLIDTAGVRKRSRVEETIEKFSIIKTLQAIEIANVVIILLDAQETVAEQDLHLIGHTIEQGRSVIIAVNKWDNLDTYQRDHIKRQLDLRLNFIPFAEIHFISALHGTGVGVLLKAVERAYVSAMKKIATAQVTRLLEEAVRMHPPPMVKGRRSKLRYAHQGGSNPPIIVVHGSQLEELPKSYQRYLENFFRKKLELIGTPIRFEWKVGENPFAGKKNLLTPRQIRKKQRLMKHVKKNK